MSTEPFKAQRDYDARMDDKGFKRVVVRAHADDRQKVLNYAANLRKRRIKSGAK